MSAKRITVYFLIILLLSLIAYYKTDITGNAIKSYEREECFVERVVDGDTLVCEIDGISQSVRLLGINTPEKGKPFYNQAKEFLIQIENQTIEMLRDNTNTDKYNRSLRYIFYKNRNLNIELVERGLAIAYMTEDIKYEDKFLRAQILAQNSEINLWKKSSTKCSQCIGLVELDPEQEFFILENTCDFDCNLEGWYVKDASRNNFKLQEIKKNQQQTINSSKNIWNNDHDEFFLRDNEGLLVLYYKY